MDPVKTEYNRLTSPGLSRQEMREEIKFLQKELGSFIDIAEQQGDIIEKQELKLKIFRFLTVINFLLACVYLYLFIKSK